MRIRTLAIAAALSAGFAPFKGAEPPVVTPARAPRLHRDIAWRSPRAGALAALPQWRAMWDRDTNVPLRLWGPALAAPGTSADAAAAEASARSFLATHLSTLAPGATLTDFTLLANEVDRGGNRTISFAQQHAGLGVIGGAVAFTFSHDKLSMISSTALPNVTVRLPGGPLAPAALASSARAWLAGAGHDVAVKAYGSRVVIPIVHSRGNRTAPDIEYRVAETLEVESPRGEGAWTVWLDASSAAPIARASLYHYASGKVLFDVPDRWPGGTRNGKAAPSAQHTVNGSSVMSMLDGTVTWDGTADAMVVPGLTGPLVKVSNKMGNSATAALTLSPGGTVTWSQATDEYGDAQLTAFVATSTAKQFARERLNPDLEWLDNQIPVSVNEQQTCNAYSTGNAIHFYKATSATIGGGLGSEQCENTGRLTDVVYHEFGHSLHNNSILPGQGAFDGALSEGLADTFAQAITGDHGMGRGFFVSDAPLRDLDPVGTEKRWPDDATGEVHDDGEIIGGTLWDLRIALQNQYGTEAGFNTWLELFYAIMQRSADIPSAYAEALLADDDDGDLGNGTPNFCLIDSVFGAHGLSDATVTLGLAPPVRDGNTINVTVTPREVELPCPAPTVDAGTLTWKARGGAYATIDMSGAADHWSAEIPKQADGTVVQYRVEIKLSDGSSITYPQNKADPDYQYYAGNVETLWCADFEGGLGDWTVGASNANRLEFEVGAPMGIGGDPLTAHGGTNVLGIDLGSDDGLYRSRTTQWAESPPIDLQGHTNVRLQYYRWLNVEDGLYDTATISANDQVVWSNYASTSENGDSTNHTDKEWVFQDVDLSAQATSSTDGTVKLKFALQSDGGLELAGWNADDVCLVIAGPPTPCAEGDASCEEPGVEGGCCSAGSKPTGPLALSLLTLGLVIRRRRARRMRQ
jgi:hypothetical protein